MSKMMRISDTTSLNLDKLQKMTRRSKKEIIEVAIEDLYKKYFFKMADQSYRKLKEDPKLHKEHLDEIAIWDTTLLDGLEDE